jgi:iron-sulfur cluster insertion protein
MAEIKARPDPVRVSERAARRISEILAGEGHPDLKLRISVSGGGCSGFQYGFALDDQAEDGDIAIEQGGARVVIDGMSLMYLLGCEVDYVEDLTGSYFRVANPNASASCGCGNSFAV